MTQQYAEWLTAIVNTRLLFNTTEECEAFLDSGSIRSNGILRACATPQKMRSAFRDLKAEACEMTDDRVKLEDVLTHYKRAWKFFRKHLYRRTYPEKTAAEILTLCYPTGRQEKLGKQITAICKEIVERDISVPFLLLMLMKAVPSYESKEGDVTDIQQCFDRVLGFLERFTQGTTVFSQLPVLVQAKEEPCKTRFTLFYYVSEILKVYENFSTGENLYLVTDALKADRHDLDLAGYWNECGGRLDFTEFWQIEDTKDPGVFFLTSWKKKASGTLTGVRYTMFVLDAPGGGLTFLLHHPAAIAHRIKGKLYGDADIAHYLSLPLDDVPAEFTLERVLPSAHWPHSLHLTRCTDAAVTAQYERWLGGACAIERPFEKYEYDFTQSLYAITPTHLYVFYEAKDIFFKVPRAAADGLEQTRLDDNVGILTMNGKHYLAFDEIMLYIPINKKNLQKYKIEKVEWIE